MVKKNTRPFTPLVPVDEPLLLSYKDVVVDTCVRCGRVSRVKRWVPVDPREEIKKHILDGIVLNQNVVRSQITLSLPKEITGPGTSAIILVSGSLEGHKLKQEYEIPFKLTKSLCPSCYKNNETYYEGELQLRNISPQMFEYLLKKIQSLENKGVYANDIKSEGLNHDIRLSDQRIVKVIALDLQQKFGGTIQNDAKLFSFNSLTSKNVFRTNVTYTAFGFGKHSVIIDREGHPFYVRSVTKVAEIDSLLKPIHKKIDAIEAKLFSVIAAEKLVVSRSQPQVIVLHPKTFQEVTVRFMSVKPQDVGKHIFGFVLDDQIIYSHK